LRADVPNVPVAFVTYAKGLKYAATKLPRARPLSRGLYYTPDKSARYRKMTPTSPAPKFIRALFLWRHQKRGSRRNPWNTKPFWLQSVP
jgi:hypothetical protein